MTIIILYLSYMMIIKNGNNSQSPNIPKKRVPVYSMNTQIYENPNTVPALTKIWPTQNTK